MSGDWLYDHLVCPRTHEDLRVEGDSLVGPSNVRYSIVKKIPIMLMGGVDPTLWVMDASLQRAKEAATAKDDADLFLDTLGISNEEKQSLIKQLKHRNSSDIDPVVSYLIGATNGIAYRHQQGVLRNYPIPSIPLPRVQNLRLLDVGCNWGRWCLAAEKLGYLPVGIDPSLGAIAAGKRVARKMGSSADYVVADGRYLPFRDNSFDVVHSYSVLQHMNRDNVGKVLSQMFRVLKPGGISLVQMPNKYGIRSLYHQHKRHFREPKDFEVRYWGINDLMKEFNQKIGPSKIFVDCFFGLGLQRSDIQFMSPLARIATRLSETLKCINRATRTLTCFADSLYIQSEKK